MLTRRGEIWHYQFDINKRRYRGSTKTSNKTLAGQIETSIRSDVLKKRAGIFHRQSPTFQKFVEEEFLPWCKVENYRINTVKRYQVSSKPLVRFFGPRPIDEIRASHIEKFKVARAAQCTNSGVNRDLAAFRYMMNYAIKQEYITENPMKLVNMLQENNGNMRIITPEEERQYLSLAPQPLKDMAILMVQTGMRTGEVLNIKSEHVYDEHILIPDGKTYFARRTIPLTEAAKEVLRARIAVTKYGWLFQTSKHPHRAFISCRQHKDVIEQMGTEFRLYDFRHTFGSRAAMAGVDLATLKELMGHSEIKMTMRYVHPTPSHKTEAMRKIEEYNKKAAPA